MNLRYEVKNTIEIERKYLLNRSRRVCRLLDTKWLQSLSYGCFSICFNDKHVWKTAVKLFLLKDGKKIFQKRKSLSRPENAKFCISKNIRSIFINFKNNVCSCFFDFLISYANLDFCAKGVTQKKWLIFLVLVLDLDLENERRLRMKMLIIYEVTAFVNK